MPKIDAVQAYWDTRPCNLHHSAAPTDSLLYSQEVTAKKFAVEPHIIWFAEFHKWAGKDVLDAGCGIGTMALEFARAGAYVDAIDLSGYSLVIGAQRASAEGLTRVDFRLHNLEIPVSKRFRYDLIWSFGVIHHTPNPDIALANLRKAVKPDGVLRLMVYNRWSLKALRLALTGGVRRQSEAQADSPITYVYSKREIKRLLQQTGWQVTRMQVEHIFPYRIADYKQHRYVKALPWRWMPGWAFRRLERLFGWHLLVEATPA